MRQNETRHQIHAADIDCHRAIPCGGIQRFDRSGQNDPCIVDQNVHRTERAADFGNDALRAFFVRHVARCGHGDPACIPNAAHGLLRVALGEGVYGNARVKRGKTQSSGLPNARARAGDENGLFRKIRHFKILLLRFSRQANERAHRIRRGRADSRSPCKTPWTARHRGRAIHPLRQDPRWCRFLFP